MNQRDATGVSVSIRDTQGVKDAQDAGGGDTPGNVQGRKAAQIPIPDGDGCIIALAVGDTSRVDVIVGPSDKACELASEAADVVEAKLPKG